MKIRLLCLSAVFFGSVSSPAMADFAQWCLDAHAEGRVEVADRMAQRVLAMRFTSLKNAGTAIECLWVVTGLEYEYHNESGRLIPPQSPDPKIQEQRVQIEADIARLMAEKDAAREAAEAERAAEAAEVARLRSEMEAQRVAEEAEQARQAARREAEAERQLQAAYEKRQREAAVIRQLGESCTRLFRRDPHGTITNRLCYDYFLANGLPE